MKKLLTLRALEQLTREYEEPVVSLYMPTVQAGRETRQNRIRFKNLVTKAEDQFLQQGWRAEPAREYLQPLRQLERRSSFWLHQEAGLAVFHARDASRLYRLPLSFPEAVVVNMRFHIKPLFRLLQGDGRFFLLALGLHGVRLYQGTRFQLEEIETPKVPASVLEALQSDTPQGNRQMRAPATPDRGAPRAGRAQPPISFGMGEEVGDRRESLLQYFHIVDHGLHEVLKEERAPLLLAGLDHLVPLYREASTYPHLVEEPLVINPSALRPEELHARSWALIEPIFSEGRRQKEDLFRRLGRTERVSVDPAAILPAAKDGRIDVLWVAADESLWGRFDGQARSVEPHPQRLPGDEDLLDAAAALTLLNGGAVYVDERGRCPASCAALLRW